MRPPTEEILEAWGGALRSRSLVYRPTDAGEVAEAISDARGRGLTVTARGGGLSYGDAALNQGGAVICMGGLSRVLDFDPERGVIRAEAGATIADVWRAALPSGWWPTVVPGSMFATLGGCVAMDVHGKNHAASGAFGRHVEAVTIVNGEGHEKHVTRREAGEPGDLRLQEVVGAQGLTGTLVDVTLRLQKVHGGYLDVEGEATPTLDATFDALDRGAREAEYTVAWVDCTGARAGRGVVHHGRYPAPDDPGAADGLDVGVQGLPRWIGGMVPRGMAWRLLVPLTNRPGIRLLNAGRYRAAAVRGRPSYRHSHAAFHFLLDYVPAWKRAYGPDGLMQYQLFVPAAGARVAFAEALRLQRELGVPSYLGVMKRHTPEESAAGYSVEGYSLALDFPFGRGERHERLRRLCHSFDAILAEHGGRVYAAKDAVGTGALPARRHDGFSSDLVRRWERGSS